MDHEAGEAVQADDEAVLGIFYESNLQLTAAIAQAIINESPIHELMTDSSPIHRRCIT